MFDFRVEKDIDVVAMLGIGQPPDTSSCSEPINGLAQSISNVWISGLIRDVDVGIIMGFYDLVRDYVGEAPGPDQAPEY